jgi:ribosomal protein S27AE
MAVEPRRGCGFRKIGGLYLVSGGRGVVCDRLPIMLTVCPTCGHGFKQTRGFTWVDLETLVGGLHPACVDDFPCPLCMRPDNFGRCAMLWIGEKFYKRPIDFTREADMQGISRRIAAVPRGFKVGESWILLAHPKAIDMPLRCLNCGAGVLLNYSTNELQCEKCAWHSPEYRAGIFHVWKPARIEKILPESWKLDPNHSMILQDLVDQGITPVFVPDDDPDHRGTV